MPELFHVMTLTHKEMLALQLALRLTVGLVYFSLEEESIIDKIKERVDWFCPETLVDGGTVGE